MPFRSFFPPFCFINYLMRTSVVGSICFHCSLSSFENPVRFLLQIYYGNIWITIWINSQGKVCLFVVKCFSRTGVETTGQCCCNRNYKLIFSKAQYLKLPCIQTVKKSVGSLTMIFSLERVWWKVNEHTEVTHRMDMHIYSKRQYLGKCVVTDLTLKQSLGEAAKRKTYASP